MHKELQQLKQLKSEEFKLTLQNSAQGLKILVQVRADQGKALTFVVFVESKFPFSFPRIYCQSAFTRNPTLSDGRDYLEDIIQRPWSPSVLLVEIISHIPAFIESVKKTNNDKAQLMALGKYHLE